MKMLKNKSRKTRKNYGHEDVTRYFLSEVQGHDDGEVEEYIESDDIYIFEGTTKEYAEEYADSAGGPMMAFSNPEYYFDFDSFGRDLKMDAALEGGLEEELEDKEEELADADDEDEAEDIQEEIDTLKENIKYYEDMSNEDYGYEYVEMLGGVKELSKQTQESYFDYDKVARDMELGGDVIEFEYDGNTYVAQAQY